VPPTALARPRARRGHFFAAAAEAVRRIPIDRARHRKRLKRAGSSAHSNDATQREKVLNGAGKIENLEGPGRTRLVLLALGKEFGVFKSQEIDDVLDEIGRGNRDAFRLVVREFSLPLRCYIASQVHHPTDVEDLSQEVFLSAYRQLGSFRRGDDFGAWLRGIARNKLHDHFRSAARRHKALERFRQEVARVVEHDLEEAVSGDSAQSIEVLLRCIARLPEKLRRIVRAGLNGDKPADLAEQFVTTVGAIYNLHYRANRLLRDCLQKELT
jgi:RNA polymerase sigma-70 factor, ECF subfamily